MLQATLARRQGGFELEVELEVEAGRTLVLVGESGSGKTTLLRLLAGLATPKQGRIELGGETWFDSAGGLQLPASGRSLGYVTQDYALFPHLTVQQNVAFGLRAQGLGASLSRERARESLAQLGVEELAPRRPADLSGGQQQRVALARALVLEPRLLLLDEPLSALDLQTRRTIRAELRRILTTRSCVTVYVTHSPLEAMAFGEQIAVMESGRITQIGSRDDLLRHPRSRYVAEFMGVNLFQGRIVSRDATGMARVKTVEGELSVVDPGGEAEVYVAVNPREIALFLEPPTGSAQNLFSGPVTELLPEPPNGERVRVSLGTHPPLVAEVTRQAVGALGLREGLLVHAAFKATGITTYR